MTLPATLSVVLPNYNHAKFLGRALRTLLGQKRVADEIIVIDDGSTDNSMAVIERFAADEPSIKVLINERNTGVIPTLGRGLQAANGRYIYFAAADDWTMPGFFELALRRLEEHPELGLFCGEAMLTDGATDRPFAVRPAVRPIMHAGPIGPPLVARMLRSTDNWILTGSAIYRRECVIQAGGFDARLGTFADGFLSRKIALRRGFFFEPKIVSTWAVFPNSVSRQTAHELDRSQQILNTVPAIIAADQDFPPWYADAFRDRWRFATCRLALQQTPIAQRVVLAMGARSGAERVTLQTILALPSRTLVRLLSLAWLWYRLQPTSLTGLFRTMLALRAQRLAVAFRFGRVRGTAPAN